MCRFNLIMVNDKNAEELLEREGYQKFNVNLHGYTAYQKGYCNCGSFVGSLINKQGMQYCEAIALQKREKLDRLYLIKNLMNQSGYREKKDEFIQKKEKLSMELHAFYKEISTYEHNQTDAIIEKYEDQELNIQMESLYKEIGIKIKELEFQPDFQIKQEAYMNFINENELMNESTCYVLTKEDEENIFKGSIPLSELLGSEEEQKPEGLEMMDLPDLSFVIDEVIARTQEETFVDNIKEYNSYYKIFSELLEFIPSLLFATVWSEPGEFKTVKTVNIESMIIDYMAYLDFNEMICIKKKGA